jgi:hypothetical protein
MRNGLIYATAISVLLLSCKTQKIRQKAIHGTFYKIDKDPHFSSEYTLDLNEDGSFFLLEKHKDGSPQCKGRWRIFNDEFVLLECNEITDPTETLTNAYMSNREHKLRILSENKLKYNDIVLRRRD